MKDTVLFLDQSTNICGYSVFENGKLAYYGHFKLAKVNKKSDIKAHTERRHYLIQQINDIIKKMEIKTVVYEGVFDNRRNPDTFRKLSKVQGSIEDYSFNNQIRFEEFPSTSWRSYLPLKIDKKGKRATREEIKQAIHKYINKTYPELKDCIEDEKEAIAMGIAWYKKKNKCIQ